MTRAAHRTLRTDPTMAQLIQAAGRTGIAAEPPHSPFEALARAIAHQQLTGAVAGRILERFIALCAPAAFPAPADVIGLSETQLRAAGFSFAKIAALKDLARKTLEGTVPDLLTLERLTDEQIIERLTAVRGIGRWTVEMLLMFRLARPDVFPVGDYGVRNGFRLAYGLRRLPTPRALAGYAERWRPHRSLAAWYLWRAVDLAREGRLPACAERPRLALERPAPRRAAAKRAKGKATRTVRRSKRP